MKELNPGDYLTQEEHIIKGMTVSIDMKDVPDLDPIVKVVQEIRVDHREQKYVVCRNSHDVREALYSIEDFLNQNELDVTVVKYAPLYSYNIKIGTGDDQWNFTAINCINFQDAIEQADLSNDEIASISKVDVGEQSRVISPYDPEQMDEFNSKITKFTKWLKNEYELKE